MDKFNSVDIIKEAEENFRDYAMSVITGRAIPAVEDGLKPIHRRILYVMKDEGVLSNKQSRKCAKIVGSVIGRLSPHGDAATYDALVRLSQPWKMRYPLISITGNNGSIQDSSAYASMRYTECKLTKIGEQMLDGIKKDSVEWQPNYDNTEEEPVYLPSTIPQILMNGTSGISVGFATDIPPHNLNELANAISAYIANEKITLAELMTHIPGPDFPTGGIIVNPEELAKIYLTGHGAIKVRAKVEFKDYKIIVKEIPFGYETGKIVAKIKDIILEHPEGNIIDVMDLSGRKGIEIVIECSKNSIPQMIFEELCSGRYAPLQSSVKCNFVIIKDKIPTEYNLLGIIKDYVEFQALTTARILNFDLKKIKAKAHVLEGIVIALANIDEVVTIVKASKNKAAAFTELQTRFNLTEVQTDAILDMKLSSLTKLESKTIEATLEEIRVQILDIEHTLSSRENLLKTVENSISKVARDFGDARRTKIAATGLATKEKKKVAPEEEIVMPIILTVTHSGIIQKTTPDAIVAQKKGGKGAITKLSHNDSIQSVFNTNTSNKLLVFTNTGIVYPLYISDIYKIQDNGGIPITTLLELKPNEKIINIVEYSDSCNELIFITRSGLIKKTPLIEYDAKRSTGMAAIKLKEGDSLLTVLPHKKETDIIVFSNTGHSIRFSLDSFSDSARVTSGSKTMKLNEGGFVVGASLITNDNDLCFTLLSDGTGKLSSITEFICQGRGGIGTMSHKITDSTISFISGLVCTSEDDILITTAKNRTLRTSVKDINITSRHTQGVNIIKLNIDDSIVGMTKISKVSNLNI